MQALAQGTRDGRLGPVGELHHGGAARQGLEDTADDAVHDVGRQRQQGQARHDGSDRRDAVIGEQARQARGIALDDARTAEMAAQEGGELRIALDQDQPLGGDARGQQRLGDLAGAGAQLDDMARPAVDDGAGRAGHRLGQQAAARHHGSGGKGPTQPALQE